MNLPTPGYGNVEVNNSGASNSGTASCALGATGINPIACRRDQF